MLAAARALSRNWFTMSATSVLGALLFWDTDRTSSISFLASGLRLNWSNFRLTCCGLASLELPTRMPLSRLENASCGSTRRSVCRLVGERSSVPAAMVMLQIPSARCDPISAFLPRIGKQPMNVSEHCERW